MKRSKKFKGAYYQKEQATRLVLNGMPRNVWAYLEKVSKAHGIKRGPLVHLMLTKKWGLHPPPSPNWDDRIPRVTVHGVPEKTVRAVEKRAEKCSSRAEALCFMLGEAG